MKPDEFGHYVWLLVEAWLDGAKLPNDLDEIRYYILKIDDDKEWKRIKKFVIDKMFVPTDDNKFLINEHQVKIWNEVLKKHLKNKSRAEKAAEARWGNKDNAPSTPDALPKHGKQSQSVNIPAEQLDIKTAMEMAGWTGNWGTLITDMGSFECVKAFWNENLSQKVKTVSQGCKGGFITKRFYDEAVEWYKLRQQAAEQKQADIEAAEQHQALLIRGESIWSLTSPEDKQKLFEQVKASSELFGSIKDGGEISNPKLRELVYLELAKSE